MTQLVAALAAQLVGYFPAALRVAGVMWFSPGLGSERIPPQVRVLAGLALAVVVVPVAVTRPLVPAGAEEFITLCLAELAFGAALGMTLSLLLEAFRFGGEVLDLQAGLRAGQLFDPGSGEASGLLSTGYSLLALFLFLQLNGHHLLLRAMAASFQMTPVGALSAQPGLPEVICDVGRSMLTIGLTVAAPVMGALLLADLALGLVARAVPQVNVFLVGLPAKIALGLAIAAAGAPLLGPQVRALVAESARYLDLVVRACG